MQKHGINDADRGVRGREDDGMHVSSFALVSSVESLHLLLLIHLLRCFLKGALQYRSRDRALDDRS